MATKIYNVGSDVVIERVSPNIIITIPVRYATLLTWVGSQDIGVYDELNDDTYRELFSDWQDEAGLPLGATYEDVLTAITDIVSFDGNGAVDIKQNLSAPDTDSVLSTEALDKYLNSKWKATSDDQSLWQVGRTTEGLVNQQDNILEEYLSLSFMPKATGPHKIEAYAIGSMNDKQPCTFQVEVTGGAINDIVIFSRFKNSEDVGVGQILNVVQGGVIIGNVDTDTDFRNDVTFKKFYNLVQGVTYTVKLKWRGKGTDKEVAIYTGSIFAELFKIN